MADIDIETASGKPAQVSNDEGHVRERTIKELIEADQYNKARSSIVKVPFGMTIARVTPRGTI